MVAKAAAPIVTPVRASKRDKELLGTDFVLTPVRRSARKVLNKLRILEKLRSSPAQSRQHTPNTLSKFNTHLALRLIMHPLIYDLSPVTSHAQTPNCYRRTPGAGTMQDLLAQTNYAFRPNDALQPEDVAEAVADSPSAIVRGTPGSDLMLTVFR